MDARTARDDFCSSVDVETTATMMVVMTTMLSITTGMVNPWRSPSFAPTFFGNCVICSSPVTNSPCPQARGFYAKSRAKQCQSME
jgi:hypothetical protein